MPAQPVWLQLLSPLLLVQVVHVQESGAAGRYPTVAEVRADPSLFDDAIKSSDVVVFTLSPTHEESSKAVAALSEAKIKSRTLPITPFKERIKELVQTDIAPSVWVYGEYIGGLSSGTLPWHGVEPMIDSGRLKHFLKTGWLHGRQFHETGHTSQGKAWMDEHPEHRDSVAKERAAANKRVNAWDRGGKATPAAADLDHDL
jgi:glutaredoxin-related protein